MLKSLTSASSAASSEVEVIVVDDGGEGEAEAAVEQAQAGGRETCVRVVKGAHGGRSVARNLGAKHAANERLLFLDDDVLLTPEVLSEHLLYARQRRTEFVRGTILNFPWLIAFEDPESGTLTERAAHSLGLERGEKSARLCERTVTLDERGRVDARLAALARTSRFEQDLHRWLSARSVEMPGRWVGATGAHISVNRSAMMEIGGFDEAMGLGWGAEDLEFGYRAEKAGIQILHAQEAVVYHMDHDSCGREGEHEAAFEYFARKHGNAKLLRLLSYFAGQLSLPEALAE
jgi:GT2 family glycosyltransferase